MKTNGATWKAYLASWPDGRWMDDSDETINGVLADGFVEDCVPDDAIVEFSSGVVYATEDDREGKDLVRHFRAWIKSQSVTRVVCEVPRGKEQEFAELLSKIGGKVVKS